MVNGRAVFTIYYSPFTIYRFQSIVHRMWEKLLVAVWRRAPKSVRRLGVRLTQPRFTVTAGAVVQDERGRVLLLKHRFRAGSGWGIPGGFINHKEQPQEGLQRELREEIGLELESASIAFVRTLKRPNQIEIIFRCRTTDGAHPRSVEIKSAAWFELESLPAELSQDQRRLIEQALRKSGV
ncbi:MAG: NUDIX domain-containing protein [Pyrinomonadaceae bacterium]